MAVKAGDLELDLIDSLIESVAARLEHESPAAYASSSASTTTGCRPRTWPTAAPRTSPVRSRPTGGWLASATAGRPRSASTTLISRRDGWDSPYTVIEIVSDDMPFLVDSVTMELSRQGYAIELIVHPVMRVVRDGDGELRGGARARGAGAGFADRVGDPRRGGAPVRLRPAGGAARRRRAGARGGPGRRRGLGARCARGRSRWPPSCAARPRRCDPHELAETQAFLRWLAEDHFTFLGYREYELGGEARDVRASCSAVPRAPAWGSCAARRPARRKQLAARAERALSAAPAGADQGQLARDRAPPVLSGLRRRQALRARTAR